MKKKSIVLLMIVVLIFPLFSTSTSLATESKVVKEKLAKDLTIEILADGRVAPIENTTQLSESNLNLILKRIGYPLNSIKNWDINRKRKLASYGGKVIEGQISDFKSEYVSSDGKSYLINPSNKDEIRKIQVEDLKKAGVSDDEIEIYNITEPDNNISLSSDYNLAASTSVYKDSFGYIQDGIWSAQLVVAKVGETSTQYKYVMMMEYYWDEQPAANWGDEAGLCWSPYGSPVANTSSGSHAVNYLGEWLTFAPQLDVSSNDGIIADIGYPTHIYGPQMGFLQEEVWVSKNHTGEQLALSGAYSHPWVADGSSLDLTGGALTFSIPLELGNKWSWRYNFTPSSY